MTTRELERNTERLLLFMAGLLLGIGVMCQPLNNAKRHELKTMIAYERLFDYWNQPQGYRRPHHHRH